MIISLHYLCLRSITQLPKFIIALWKVKCLKCLCHGPAYFQQQLTSMHNVKILLKIWHIVSIVLFSFFLTPAMRIK